MERLILKKSTGRDEKERKKIGMLQTFLKSASFQPIYKG